jgi:hypothetical protein
MANVVHRRMYLGTRLFSVYGKFSIEQFILALQLSHLTFQVLHALLEAWVLPLDRVDNSINLCKHTSGWYFRHWAVWTGHLILE